LNDFQKVQILTRIEGPASRHTILNEIRKIYANFDCTHNALFGFSAFIKRMRARIHGNPHSQFGLTVRASSPAPDMNKESLPLA
jgi:hypothetical protein